MDQVRPRDIYQKPKLSQEVRAMLAEDPELSDISSGLDTAKGVQHALSDVALPGLTGSILGAGIGYLSAGIAGKTDEEKKKWALTGGAIGGLSGIGLGGVAKMRESYLKNKFNQKIQQTVTPPAMQYDSPVENTTAPVDMTKQSSFLLSIARML